MIKRLGRTLALRLGLTLLVAFTLTAGIFVLYEQLPTDPAHFLDPDPHATTTELAPFNRLLGTDRPVVTQYADYVWHAIRGDFGVAWSGIHQDCHQTAGLVRVCPGARLVGAPVGRTIVESLSVTGSLVLGGAVLLVLIAVPLGLLAASRPRSWVDRTSVALVLLGISTHPLVVGVVLQTLFAKRWNFAPDIGYCTLTKHAKPDPNAVGIFYLVETEECHGVQQWASHLILPWITFALFFAAIYMRMLRSSTIDTLREPYISTARAKGASESRILLGHAFPNAVLPILTMLAMDAGLAIGVAIYIEVVYGMPGVGLLARSAFLGIVGWDRPMIVGLVLTVALVIMVFNAIVNALYVVVDPRAAGPPQARRSRVSGGLV